MRCPDFINESKKSDSVSITILEALPTILQRWEERIVKKVEDVLHEKGIRIMTSSPVAKVENVGADSSDVCLSGGKSKDSFISYHLDCRG